MPLPTNLNTNEVRNAAGTEVEFISKFSDGNSRVYQAALEQPAYPHRITVSHQTIGSGTSRRRRSLIRVDFTHVGAVDTTLLIRTSAYLVVDFPEGNQTGTTVLANVLAELCSLISTLGTSTHLYDGTGNGAAVLLNGTF